MNSLKLLVKFTEKIIISISFLLLPILAAAQSDSIMYNVDFMGIVSSGKYSPFWLQSNQYGMISSFPTSANIMVGVNKDFGLKTRLFDYGFKVNLLTQTFDTKTYSYFHEYYVKARFSIFDFILGARKEQFGNQDSTLSSGGFLFSQNARPMPKVTIGIEHFTVVPFTYGFLEVKGAIAHGWYTDNIYTKNLWLHQKYIYVKIGGTLPVHFQYGIDHVAQWGGIVPGSGQQPTSLKDFIRIFFARSGGSGSLQTDQFNSLGNHIGSQSMKLDVDISDFKISGYWQKVFEDGPIKQMWNAQNRADGLWGLSIRNSKFPLIKGLLFEYLNTTDQSGPYLDKDGIIYGGNDNYFNNSVYQNGWTYYSRTVGTPFITSPIYNSNGAVYIVNNRVQVFHIGLEGDVSGYRYKFLSSFSKNYGSYNIPYPEMIPNTSTLLEVYKQIPKLSNIEVGCSVGADFGKLYGNSVGCMFSIKKTGNLFNY